MRRVCSSVIVLSACLVACSSQDDGGDLFGNEQGSSSGILTGDGDGDGDGDGGETGGTERLDASADDGAMTGDDGVATKGCQAVDFLFVIDNSGSMGDNQQNLVNSFPGFISAIQGTVAEAQDYHIMVAKTDAGWGTTVSPCVSECLLLQSCITDPTYDCANPPPPPMPPSPCDSQLGAGVVYPKGTGSSDKLCNLASGKRYITPADTNLGQAFTCIASVGTDGDADERQIEALTAALSTELNDPGGCNEGFLRDEAILVVTLITDEDDINSPGVPAGWYQNIISRKSGDGGGVVMIGLLNDTDLSNPVCAASAPTAPGLVEFVESFPNNYRGSVCANDYSTVLADAVSLIDTACEEYVPPAG